MGNWELNCIKWTSPRLFLTVSVPVNFNVDSDKICKLNQGLYGLKKSLKYWYDAYDETFKKHYLRARTNDCRFYYKTNDSTRIYFLVYVDDSVTMSTNNIKKELFTDKY